METFAASFRGGLASGPTGRSSRRGASGCWMLVLLAVVGVVVAGILVVRRVSALQSNERFVASTWHEVHLQYGRRMDLLRELLATSEGKRYAGTEGAKALRRAREGVERVALSGSAYPESQDELDAYLQAQERTTMISDRLIGTIREAHANPSGELAAVLEELDWVDRRIVLAHRDFYDAVTKYNGAIRAVPDVFLAKIVGLERSPQPLVRLLDEEGEEAGT